MALGTSLSPFPLQPARASSLQRLEALVGFFDDSDMLVCSEIRFWGHSAPV